MHADVLILPGLGDSGPDHWQSHWQRARPQFRRVMQHEWDAPHVDDWIATLDAAIAASEAPVVLAAHSSACAMVAHWAVRAPQLAPTRVRGALLVAPTDPDGPNYPAGPVGFGPVPLARLPFASIVVASTDDPYLSEARAREYAHAWGSRLVVLADAGHINAASGHGAWPEGLAMLDTLAAVSSTGALA